MIRTKTLLALGLLGGVAGCLASFAPKLRSAGPHAGLEPGVAAANETCMSCHESEADALARMRASGSSPTPMAMPMPMPMAMDMSGPPLVADWMITDERPCAACHRIRP